MNLKDMGFTLDHGEILVRVDRSVRALASVVSPIPLIAAGGLLGSAIQWLVELGVPPSLIHDQVDSILGGIPDAIAQLRRMQVKLVPEEDESEHSGQV